MLSELVVEGVAESDESVDRERVESAELLLEPDPARDEVEDDGDVELELEDDGVVVEL
jgi:hypothetical protein